MTSHSLTTLSNSTATRLTPSGIHSGLDITVQNVHAVATVYIGGEGVTSSDYGYRLLAGTAVSFELPGRDALYAISSTNLTQVAVIKTGLESGN
jgi:hypothetical protein